MLSRRRRLRKLERSPSFQPPADPTDAIVRLALQKLSDEQLDLLRGVVENREKGMCRDLIRTRDGGAGGLP